MILNVWGKEYNVYIKKNTYASNGNLAIQLFEDDGTPFAVLTVNIGELPPGYAYLDVNNCPWAEEFVIDNNLGEYADDYAISGFCIYPLYKFYMWRIGDAD